MRYIESKGAKKAFDKFAKNRCSVCYENISAFGECYQCLIEERGYWAVLIPQWCKLESEYDLGLHNVKPIGKFVPFDLSKNMKGYRRYDVKRSDVAKLRKILPRDKHNRPICKFGETCINTDLIRDVSSVIGDFTLMVIQNSALKPVFMIGEDAIGIVMPTRVKCEPPTFEEIMEDCNED